MSIAVDLADKLLQIKAIKLNLQNPFTWASGLKSPIYCDNRVVLSYPEIRNFVKSALVAKARSFPDFDTVAGVATAGIAHGVLLADAMQLPFVYVRGKAKDHGRQNLIEGDLRQARNVLVVEDLISTGGSCLQAAQALQQNRVNVVGVLALFSYGFDKAETAFSSAGLPYKTLSNYNNLIQQAVKRNYVSSSDLGSLQEWRDNPEEWAIKRTI